MIRMLIGAAALASVALLPASPVRSDAGPLSAGAVKVTVVPESLAVDLGQSSELVVTVENTSSLSTQDLVVHIDVLDPSSTTSVDPEDWTPELNRQIGSLDAGQSVATVWDIKPISGGRFVLYATVLSSDGVIDEVAVSSGLIIEVREQRQLNPQGVVPVSLGIPVVVAGALVFNRRRSPAR